MNKKTTKLNKLSLNKETLVRLNDENLSRVAAGRKDPPPIYQAPTKGFLWCDLSVVPDCRA